MTMRLVTRRPALLATTTITTQVYTCKGLGYASDALALTSEIAYGDANLEPLGSED